MKVSNTGTNSVQSPDVSNAKAAQQAKKAEKTEKGSASSRSSAKSSIPGANAELSSKGKDAAKAREVATSTPDVREDKIAEIKQRIASSNYKVDAQAVADKLVDEHLKSI